MLTLKLRDIFCLLLVRACLPLGPIVIYSLLMWAQIIRFMIKVIPSAEGLRLAELFTVQQSDRLYIREHLNLNLFIAPFSSFRKVDITLNRKLSHALSREMKHIKLICCSVRRSLHLFSEMEQAYALWLFHFLCCNNLWSSFGRGSLLFHRLITVTKLIH